MCHPLIVVATSRLGRSIWPYIIAAFAGTTFIALYGIQRGWTPLTIFLVQAGLLVVLGWLGRTMARIVMGVVLVLEAVPVFGLGTVAPLAVAVGVATWAIMWRRYLGGFGSAVHALRRDLAVAEEARTLFNELRRLDFRPVASADITGPGFQTIFTYMLTGDGYVYAEVTDRVLALVSVFGERLLVTTDQGSLPVPPTQLRQVVTGDPSTVLQGHRQALAILAEHQLYPDQVHPAQVFEVSRQADRQAVEFLLARPWRAGLAQLRGHLTHRPPDSDAIGPDSERIRQWAVS